MDNTLKQKRNKIGQLGIQLLAYAQLRKKEMIFTGEIAQALGLSKKQEIDLLARMTDACILIRLKRGVYLVPERMPPGGKWNVSEYYLLTRLMQVYKGTYQISGPNAFNFYGFDDQVPNRLYIYNDRIYGEKNINGREFIFIKTAEERLGAARKIKTTEGISICIVSKARACVDAVYDWSRYNTIPRAYSWIIESMQRDSGFEKKIISVTAKYGNKSSIRRIGYLLSSYGIAESSLLSLKRLLGKSKSLIPWIPGKSATGSINTEWGVIVNGVIPK